MLQSNSTRSRDTNCRDDLDLHRRSDVYTNLCSFRFPLANNAAVVDNGPIKNISDLNLMTIAGFWVR